MIGAVGPLVAVGLVVMAALASSSRASGPGDMAVSLIQLIASPGSFDGKRVVVTGYVMLEFENTAVYLHESDARYGIFRNGLWLDVSVDDEIRRAQLHGRYAVIEATFSARRRGHLDVFSGSLEKVGRFEVVEPRPGPLMPAPH